MSDPGPVKSWSYSALKLYEQCPLRYKLEKIDKIQTPQHPAAERGTQMHAALEAYVKDEAKALPAEAQKYKWLLEPMRLHADKAVEAEWGFARDWKPAPWKGAWLRVKADVVLDYGETVTIVDHKSGKVYPEHRDQMRLYALAAMLMYGKAQKIDTRLVYYDGDAHIAEDYGRGVEYSLQAEWAARAEPLFADREFAPRPNSKCRWCPFRRGEGGPCKFG